MADSELCERVGGGEFLWSRVLRLPTVPLHVTPMDCKTYFAGSRCFFNPKFRQVCVNPTAKPILLVPLTLSVSYQYYFVRCHLNFFLNFTQFSAVKTVITFSTRSMAINKIRMLGEIDKKTRRPTQRNITNLELFKVDWLAGQTEQGSLYTYQVYSLSYLYWVQILCFWCTSLIVKGSFLI